MINLMEVCGTHTMSIARNGIKSMLPENMKLLSGPGCPVCVTAQETIDAVLTLSAHVTIATYGDMIRVPGSRSGDSLGTRKGEGARVEVVYSPMDAIEIAKNTEQEVVFLGVGFETTAPGTAVAIKMAAEQKIKNFSVLSVLKRVEPALRTLIKDKDFNIQGFLCPGHVATIIGEDGFRFLVEEYGIPSVIAGFEPIDILRAIGRLDAQIKAKIPKLENCYTRAVTEHGNEVAKKVIDEVFEKQTDLWRGLGEIPESGLGIREKYSQWDAKKKFGIKIVKSDIQSPCRCGDVIQGKIEPCGCPMFGKSCTPENPMGPCMVSSEGACAAWYRYYG